MYINNVYLHCRWKSFIYLFSRYTNWLKKILSTPNICEKKWIWEQYDHTVMGDTIQKPGGDAGVVRIHNTNKAIAATVDSSSYYCYHYQF